MELLYAANPMCSWCWGFAPAMRALHEARPDLRLTVVTGQLGHGDGPMRPKDKAEVKRHWEHVHERTGQPFDWAFFERDGFVYDTEPPCRALILVRSAFPALAHPFLERLHERFYKLGDDVTDAALLAETATEFGVERDAFERHFEADEAKAATLAEWQGTARIGINGYPALLALGAGKPRVVAYGWKPTAEVLAEVAAISAPSSAP